MSIWRPNTTGILIGGFVVVIIAAAAAFLATHFQPTVEVRLGSGVYQAKIARDEAARELGLSGTESMKPNDALIMAFPSDDTWEIWMKDMKVSIDIIWLNSDKEIIHIVKNASPSLGTDKIFKPTDKARYVIELPAGSVQLSNIKVGEKATFEFSGEVQ